MSLSERHPQMPKTLRAFFLLIDLGFLLYWLTSALDLLPKEWMFKDYQEPVLDAWNWSFLSLDLIASGTGIYAVWRAQSGQTWQGFGLISLTLTFCAGLQAISFWALRHDVSLTWWTPNVVLMLGPLYFILRYWRTGSYEHASANAKAC